MSDEFSLPTAEEATSAMQEQQQQQQQQQAVGQQQPQEQRGGAGDLNLPFGINLGNITNSIRTWSLDID